MDSRGLDALVAEKVMGWTVAYDKLNGYDVEDGEGAIGFPPGEEIIPNVSVPYAIEDYSTDIRDAWRVVEKMRADGYGADINVRDDYMECDFWRGNHTDGVASADTVPEAICLAALRAKDIDATQGG
jgi:hypothetical protein